MAQVKFVNIAKYKGVRYPAHTPFEVDDNDVETLVKAGAIVIIPAESVEGGEAPTKTIDGMKVDELKAYAEEHNIDISGATKRTEIIAAIKAAKESEE